MAWLLTTWLGIWLVRRDKTVKKGAILVDADREAIIDVVSRDGI